jgi:hypothetical protein
MQRAFFWCNFANHSPLSGAPASNAGCTDWVHVNPGSIVQYRSREWVLLSGNPEVLLMLRPLTGATDEVVAIHKGLTDLLGVLVLQPLVGNGAPGKGHNSAAISQYSGS